MSQPTRNSGQQQRLPQQQRPQSTAREPDSVAPGQSSALVQRVAAIGGLHRTVDTLRAALHDFAPRVHLLSPTINPEMVPEFHEIAIRPVTVDPNPVAGEVYKLPGGAEVALTKVSLDRIAAAAGITWDAGRSGRLDDRSDPHYCHFRAVGTVRDLDGSRRTLVGEKEIDLRDGTPSIFTDDERRMAVVWANGRATDKIDERGRGYVRGWSRDRLDGARTHILAMAESKAKNRAIRQLGVKAKYTTAELMQKPFVCLSLVFTGASDDPDLQRLAKERMLDVALQTSRELYGAEPPHARMLRAPEDQPPPALEHHAPPPIAAVPADEDDEPGGQIQDAEIICGCPDGPAGTHEPGCPEGGTDGE